MAGTLLSLLVFAGCPSLIPSCVKAAEPGESSPEGMVAVVGKVSFEPVIQQKFEPASAAKQGGPQVRTKSYESSLLGKFFGWISTDPHSEPDTRSFSSTERVVNQNWGEYFVIYLPEGRRYYWRTVEVVLELHGADPTLLLLRTPFETTIEPETTDDFVYIGDITYRLQVTNDLGGKEERIYIRDNFERASAAFGSAKLTVNGQPAELRKRLLRGSGRSVESEVIRIRTRFVAC